MAKTLSLTSTRERRGMLLCYFWVGCTILFACLAWVASQGISTRLPRAGFRISVHGDNRPGRFRAEEIVNDVAERHDRTVAVLEEFIHRTARTNVLLNLLCVALSGVALGGQCFSLFSRARESTAALPRPTSTPIPHRLRSDPSAPPEPALALHDGSFPDSGYAH